MVKHLLNVADWWEIFAKVLDGIADFGFLTKWYDTATISTAEHDQ